MVISLYFVLGFYVASSDTLVFDLGAEVKVGESVKVDPAEFEACIHLSQVRVLRGGSVFFFLFMFFLYVDKLYYMLLCRLLLVRQRKTNQMNQLFST